MAQRPLELFLQAAAYLDLKLNTGSCLVYWGPAKDASKQPVSNLSYA